MHKRFGFTLIEVMVVLIIITLLAAIFIPMYNGTQIASRDSKRESDVQIILNAYDNNFSKVGTYGDYYTYEGGIKGYLEINSNELKEIKEPSATKSRYFHGNSLRPNIGDLKDGYIFVPQHTIYDLRPSRTLKFSYTPPAIPNLKYDCTLIFSDSSNQTGTYSTILVGYFKEKDYSLNIFYGKHQTKPESTQCSSNIETLFNGKYQNRVNFN